MSQSSPFDNLSLSTLKEIFQRNNLKFPESRSNWRKSYISIIEKREYSKLILTKNEIILLEINDDAFLKYKIHEELKRKRETETEETEDDDDDDDETEENEDEEKEEGKEKKKKRRKIEISNGSKALDFLLNFFDEQKEEIYKILLQEGKGKGKGEIDDDEKEGGKIMKILEWLNDEKSIKGIKRVVLNMMLKNDVLDINEIIKNITGNSTMRNLTSLMNKKICEKSIPYIQKFIKEMFKGLYDEKDEKKIDEFIAQYFMFPMYFIHEFVEKFVDKSDLTNLNDQTEDAPTINRINSPTIPQTNVLPNAPGNNAGNNAQGGRRISIRIVSSDGLSSYFSLNRNTRLITLFNAFARTKGVCVNSYRFNYDGQRVDGNLRAGNYGMQDGDTIDVMMNQTGGKPVILIYPRKEIKDVDVELNLNSKIWKIKTYYPKIREVEEKQSQAVYNLRWKNMSVKPNGEITYEKRVYPYLFWESETIKNVHLDFDDSKEIFLVSREQISKFLYQYLSTQKLKEKDICDFVTYWIGKMEENKFCLIQFMNRETYEKIAQVEITPKPDIFIKIFMIFLSIPSFHAVKIKKDKIVSQNYEKYFVPFDRDLKDKYVCYEWGGCCLHQSKVVSL